MNFFKKLFTRIGGKDKITHICHTKKSFLIVLITSYRKNFTPFYNLSLWS